jgi:lysophospholipase L1-like esterase
LKRRRVIYIIFILISLFISFLYIYNRFSIAHEHLRSPILETNNDTTLTIGIIGDSWVAAGNFDPFIKNSLRKNGHSSYVYSSGLGGAKTKHVYMNLFAPERDFFSTAFIKQKQVKYCIISCGVNDSFGQFGKRFYSKNMCLIIKELLKYNIKPVVVELPEYGVDELYNTLHIVNKIKTHVYAFFTSDSGLDNIKEYREALNEELKKQLLLDKIVFVDFDAVCNDYSKCSYLYYDHLHLTDEGYSKLADEIAAGICTDLLKH